MGINKRSNLKIYLLLLAIGTAILFSSFGNIVTVDERALVHAMGIDFSDSVYTVTLQVFKPTGSGSDTPLDTSQPNVQVIKSEGETVSQALTEAGSQIGREVFLGHLQLICFGSGVDFSNPEELFQFATKDKNIYLGVKLCVSETTAEDIMNAQISRGTTSAEAMKQILEINIKNSNAPDCEIIDFLSCTDTPQYISMPVVAVVNPQEQSSESGSDGEQGGTDSRPEPQLIVTSSAIVKNGRFVLNEQGTPNILSHEQYQGVAWLSGKAEESEITLEHDGVPITLSLTKDKIRISLENEDGRLVYKCKITLTAHSTKDIKTQQESDELGRETAEKVFKLCQDSVQTAFEDNGADVFGVWRYLRQSYPKAYLECQDRLDEIYGVTDFDISVNVRVE